MDRVLDKFIRRQNVARFQRLFETATEETDRQRLLKLLAEERQKQIDAGDPEFKY